MTFNSGNKVAGEEGGEGVNWHSTQERKFWVGEGGEGREGRGGRGSIDIQLRKESCRWGGRGGEGDQLTVNLERICKDIARITSDNVDSGGVNQHSTQERKFWVGREGREGGNQHSTQETELQVRREGRGVNRHSTQERKL